MFASALRRDVADRAFEDFQQRLLHAFAAHVACDGRAFRPARDLVNLVNVDDAALRALHVVIGILQEAQNNIFHVLADITGFVNVVASALANGASRIFASVRASKVLPEPVGPIIKMLLFSISTPACGSTRADFVSSFSGAASGWMRL